jgi:hypothetical protein
MMENPQEPMDSRSTLDRLADALRSLDDQLGEARGRFDARVKEVQERVEKTWKDGAQRARDARTELENRREQLTKTLEETPIFRHVQDTVRRIEEQVTEARGQFLTRLGLVSKSELERLSTKLEELAQRLREIADQKQP